MNEQKFTLEIFNDGKGEEVHEDLGLSKERFKELADSQRNFLNEAPRTARLIPDTLAHSVAQCRDIQEVVAMSYILGVALTRATIQNPLAGLFQRLGASED